MHGCLKGIVKVEFKLCSTSNSDVTGGWAIARLVFGRIEGAAFLVAHPTLDSYLRPCPTYPTNLQTNDQMQCFRNKFSPSSLLINKE